MRADIEFAYESIMAEGWNYTKKDVERMLRYNPLGCFIAEVNEKPAGHVFSVNYGKLGWIGLLIVKAENRGKGLGTSLTKKALDHLVSSGVETVKLEAAPAAAGLYRKLGFIDEYDSLRFLGKNCRPISTYNSNVKLLEKETINEVARFDAKYFGGNRTQVLMKLYRDYPKLCFASYAGSKINGYIMCRKTEKGYRVGPWLCDPDNPEVAEDLLTKCMETIRRNVEYQVGVPGVNNIAVKILREFGFKQYAKSIRMRFGKELETERVYGIFAIGGPEKG